MLGNISSFVHKGRFTYVQPAEGIPSHVDFVLVRACIFIKVY